jgi:hypothetical protein
MTVTALATIIPERTSRRGEFTSKNKRIHGPLELVCSIKQLMNCALDRIETKIMLLRRGCSCAGSWGRRLRGAEGPIGRPEARSEEWFQIASGAAWIVVGSIDISRRQASAQSILL